MPFPGEQDIPSSEPFHTSLNLSPRAKLARPSRGIETLGILKSGVQHDRLCARATRADRLRLSSASSACSRQVATGSWFQNVLMQSYLAAYFCLGSSNHQAEILVLPTSGMSSRLAVDV